jgi:hypothetical protein
MNNKRETAKFEAAVEAMLPLLQAASAAAHELAKAEDDDPDDAEFSRLVDLGMLTDCVGRLCGPNLAVLVRVMFKLMEHGSSHKEEETGPQRLHHH